MPREKHKPSLLESAGLAFAVSMLAPELPPHRGARRRKSSIRKQVQQRVLSPITPPAIYGRATTLALKALER